MAHAWLDSLSEDWVSQPGSDSSAVGLPPLRTTENKHKPFAQDPPSRIPRRTPAGRSSVPAIGDSSINVLSERSANDINIASRKLPSKLSQEIKNGQEDSIGRSFSASTNASVIHNTIERQSLSADRQDETPEWKRRLLHGDVQYGEQRDLFCSAAAGLQDMFKPPTSGGVQQAEEVHETTLPSSPPLYSRGIATTDFGPVEIEEVEEEDEPVHPNELSPTPSPNRRKRNASLRMSLRNASAMNTPSHRVTSRAGARQQNDSIYRDDSCLSAPSDIDGNTRKTSGQSDTRNEDFSPILIGRHSDNEGKVDFAPIEVPADQLKQKLERLRINQMLLDSTADAQAGFDEDHEDVGNLDNTEDYARQGGFINFKRGGRSAEGSFRYRGLSPGLGGDTSEMLPEESLQASTPKQFPTFRTELAYGSQSANLQGSPVLPKAPFPSPEKRAIRDKKSNSQAGGSPLKLFGPYDTFTNQTLLRRISQFEEGTSGNTSRQSSNNEAAVERPSPSSLQQVSSGPGSRSVSQFGVGDLEGYEFDGDVSYAGDEESRYSHDKENISPPGTVSRPPLFSLPVRNMSPSEDSDLIVHRRRDKSISSSASKAAYSISASGTQPRKPVGAPFARPDETGTPKRDSGSEGKRPRTSPSKDPTPKRRRTLHKSDIAFGRDHSHAVDSTSQLHFALGKKRKDARPGRFQLADPSILALRSILRPRSPSGRLLQTSEYDDSNDESSVQQPNRAFARALRGASLSLSKSISNEVERKPSIRTQDFVDQAAQIMAMIRNQVKPPGLASLEESEAEHGNLSPQGSDELHSESTKEPFSRPPSREGKTSPARLAQRQEDPHLADMLRKYREISDLGDVISSSIRSVGFVKEAGRAARQPHQQAEGTRHGQLGLPLGADENRVISDIPNVRISTNPAHNGFPASPSRDFPSNSSGHSHGTYPTGSSRGSDSRKVIMPESVSHLIPNRVGSMRLDKDSNVWIKDREIRRAQPTNVLPSEDSEEDPFASIPDLSVDLTKEMQNLRLTAARRADDRPNSASTFSPPSPVGSGPNYPGQGYVALTPNGRRSPALPTLARNEIEKFQSQDLSISSDTQERPAQKIDSEGDKACDSPTTARRRNITISFSSPVASIIQDVLPEDLNILEDDPVASDLEDSKVSPTRGFWRNNPKPALKQHSQSSLRPGNGVRPVSRGPEFVPRPVSRIDEQDEDSTVELPHDEGRQISIIGETSLVSHMTPGELSYMVNRTPGGYELSVRGDESALIGHNVGKLSLSPLSEFTLNNSDQSFGFEVSYVMGHRHMETGSGTKRVMSMTIRELVDKLSEVEPFEPYWEDITELNLQDKRLTSLHMLDEFCGKVVTLDASKNALGHLDGVPPTVRQLNVRQNVLTELTSWDHLANLQYVDISGNEVKSLSALRGLVHLRSLTADDNQLRSLDGLDGHDGLLSLRARNNEIEELDFAGLKLTRLTELDLEGNLIRSVENLELVPQLSSLRLRKNQLAKFGPKASLGGLHQLDVSDNDLTFLDLSCLPDLRSLHADRNLLTEIRGFGHVRHLDSLSLREQRGSLSLDTTFLSEAYEIRKLFLSGNYLGGFEPQVDFLNLQMLELANCGLESLPENLGQLMPNLRTLNLNFNAISDLQPLRFVPRLKKLLAAGNRLADSTAVTDLLTDFPHLKQLDLRDNPITLGFYAPLQVLVPADRPGSVDLFVLPHGDVGRDELFAGRLDEATRLRRRLHQIAFAASCKKMRILDGLPIKRCEVLARDKCMMTLIADGLLPPLPDPSAGAEPDFPAKA